MSTRVRSFCKINLGLAIGPARPDDFHALTTLYQTLALHDLVTVTARPASETSITLTADHRGVPRTEAGNADRNTAFRIVDLALRQLGIAAEVTIDIQKRLPVQGGLGAGSANAAAAFIGVERELNRSLPGPDRLALAAQIGSDVPLFLLGGSVLGLSRGEEVYPLPDLPVTPCVVAVPSLGVSTAVAFQRLDAQMTANSLTSTANPSKLEQLSRALSAVWSPSGANLGQIPETAKGTQVPEPQEPSPSGITRQPGDLAEDPLLALVRTGIENDFEEVVFQEHPSLRSTKRDLVGDSSVPEGSRALYAALSGSGSALFGLYRSTADARAAQQRVQASGTQALLTETLPRADYWNTMLEIGRAPI
ncbi:MAG TPA: 4-(cytidine 5'-diphospho)-2-C-methyl-D-erythritol kinase [Acidobacteriaceae bacterium]|nr:4-(cytidine 5'-diphospho)-2-C-methyl-D-erythritol kinase [Acidobacteriaceae bacterium]